MIFLSLRWVLSFLPSSTWLLPSSLYLLSTLLPFIPYISLHSIPCILRLSPLLPCLVLSYVFNPKPFPPSSFPLIRRLSLPLSHISSLSSPLLFLNCSLLAVPSTFLPSYYLLINAFSIDTTDRWPVGLPRIPRLAFTLCATPPVFVCCGVFQELSPPLGTYTSDVLTGFSQVTERPKPYLIFA